MHFIDVRIIPFQSSLYDQAVMLRRRVLRWPLGMDIKPEQLLGEGSDVHFVAVDGETVVGCLVLTRLESGEAKMRAVAVDPDRQGQGIGRQMVKAFEAYCIEQGLGEIVLNARDTAILFYESLGYSVDGEGFVEVTVPHHRMRKSVG